MTVLTTLHDALCIKKYFYSSWWEFQFSALCDCHELFWYHFLVVPSLTSLEGWSIPSQILEGILLQVSMAYSPFFSPLLSCPINLLLFWYSSLKIVVSTNNVFPTQLGYAWVPLAFFWGMDGIFLGSLMEILGSYCYFSSLMNHRHGLPDPMSENSYFLHSPGFSSIFIVAGWFSLQLILHGWKQNSWKSIFN